MSLKISELEMQAIQSLFNQMKDELKIKKILLFGSKARGDDSEYSDVDLLVLTEKPKTFEDRCKLSDASVDVNVNFGVALSCIYFNDDDWESGENVNPKLKQNIEKEGIELALN